MLVHSFRNTFKKKIMALPFFRTHGCFSFFSIPRPIFCPLFKKKSFFILYISTPTPGVSSFTHMCRLELFPHLSPVCYSGKYPCTHQSLLHFSAFCPAVSLLRGTFRRPTHATFQVLLLSHLLVMPSLTASFRPSKCLFSCLL